MMTIIISTLSLALIGASLRQIFHSLEFEHKIFSLQLFVSIMLLYTIVMVGFGIIYAVLMNQGIVVYEENIPFKHDYWVRDIVRSIYFSGVTLFTVGYGDIIPMGVGKWIAIVEAMIGYTLPAALVAKVWLKHQGDR
ncbi:potassium channel LctB [Halobacillus karajensis]|uniref:Ion channel n=1 Tax=Halobacillus karajensis TaxID=195088 RepID=A0A024P5P5_9BACI|nr:potassium channel family protein [Halobacillus karajensis]CDQ20366.1 Ion channel [Halobacillus karajensis]CDQ24165.1 Ion channel [Halobacillus karajensis]CDQ27643.1 Ion channel [Halobacillus karajensis]SEH92778.1 potassium channel LctB [Halobacillus karajensis]